MSKQVGTLVQKSDLKEFDGGFRVQEFYLDCKRYNQDDGTEYPNMLKFQVVVTLKHSRQDVLTLSTKIMQATKLNLYTH